MSVIVGLFMLFAGIYSVYGGGKTAVIEMLLNGRDRVHHRADKGVMIPYQPTGEDMDFIRSQDCIHTDLSWQVTGLLSDMRLLLSAYYGYLYLSDSRHIRNSAAIHNY